MSIISLNKFLTEIVLKRYYQFLIYLKYDQDHDIYLTNKQFI